MNEPKTYNRPNDVDDDEDQNQDYIRQSLDRRMGGRDYGGEYRRRGMHSMEGGVGRQGRPAVGGISAGYRGMYDENDPNYGADYSGRGRFDDHDLPDRRDMESNAYGSRMNMRRGPHTGKGPKGYQRSDERIREDACDILTEHGEIDASDMEVSVANGEITLSGFADDRRSKRLAADLLESISGMKDIHNHLRLRPTEDYTGSTPTDELARKGDMKNALIQNEMQQTTMTGKMQASPLNKSTSQG